MNRFDFITDREYRASLEADYREMVSCLEASAWKAVHVLAGSIIEAVLIDYVSGQPQPPKIEKIDLGKLIDYCEEQKIISEETEKLCTVIRLYRNLIHPERAIRLQKSVTSSGARIASALVNELTAEIEKRKKENYGWTADQITSKLLRDSASFAITTNLLKGCHSSERAALVLDSIPNAYLDTIRSPDHDDNTLGRLSNCFHLAMEMTTEDVQIKVARKHVEMVVNGDEATVIACERGLFNFKYLQYVSDSEARMVAKHFLTTLGAKPGIGIAANSSGISKYLEYAERHYYLHYMLREVIAYEPEAMGSLALTLSLEVEQWPKTEIKRAIRICERRYRTTPDAATLEQIPTEVSAALTESDTPTQS